MALSADKTTEYMEGVDLSIPVDDGDKIYAGAIVCVNAAGYAVVGADTAGQIFMGIAREQADNSSGADGAINVTVRRRGLFKMKLATAITIANVGDNVFIADDESVDLAGNVTNDIFVGIIASYIDTTHAWVDIEPAIRQADVATHIADTSAAHSASAISIADAGKFTAQTEVEAALQEIYPHVPKEITDPGASGAIPVTRSGNVPLTTAAAETRTLAIPAVAGITLSLSLAVDGGDCTITAASAINQTGDNTIVLGDAGDTIVLIAVKKATGLVWRVLVNDGCALSTV